MDDLEDELAHRRCIIGGCYRRRQNLLYLHEKICRLIEKLPQVIKQQVIDHLDLVVNYLNGRGHIPFKVKIQKEQATKSQILFIVT